jgi:hypothetical protein
MHAFLAHMHDSFKMLTRLLSPSKVILNLIAIKVDVKKIMWKNLDFFLEKMREN